MNRITIVGNGVSGWACATRLAESGASVRLIGPGLPYDRPPLSKRALTSGRIPWSTTLDGLAERGIEHLDGIVAAIDTESRWIEIHTANGSEGIVVDGPLVWAAGLRYPSLRVPGSDTAVAYETHTAAGSAALHDRLNEGQRSVVIIGAGLIGTETAATVARMGHEAVLLDRLPDPVSALPAPAIAATRSSLVAQGVTFLGGCDVSGISGRGDIITVSTRTHGDIQADTLVVAAGTAPNVPVGLGASPELIDVDHTLRITGLDDIWACGDCIRFPHPRWGRISIPHWDNALHSGRHVADAILGSDEPYARDPYWFTDIGPLRMQLVGYASAVADWDDTDPEAIVGYDTDGTIAAMLLMNAPQQLAEARARVSAVSTPA